MKTKKNRFAKRSEGIDSSFIRDILSLANKSDIISFAGGLPNADLFPYKKIQKAANIILKNAKSAKEALQYGDSSGYFPLKEIIAKTYKIKDGLDIDPNLMIITNGSQQAIDLTAKIFVDKKDKVLFEEFSYLAAMQSFAFYEPSFDTIKLLHTGPDVAELQKKKDIKLFYFVPNFQNPSGVTWNTSTRKAVAKWANKNDTILLEDDPYGEIRFEGKRQVPVAKFAKKRVIMAGSFSKILCPGIRVAWLIAPNREIYEKLIVAKQASDLQSNQFAQRIIYEFYTNFDAQEHIEKISQTYKKQRDCLAEELSNNIPEFKFNLPEGGMFLWGYFESGIDTIDFLQVAVNYGVAFVPGFPFFAKDAKGNYARFSFSTNSCSQIKEGVKRLKKAYNDYMGASK